MKKVKSPHWFEVLKVIANVMLSIFSLFAIIMLLVGGLVSVDEVRQHRQYVHDMQATGKVAIATVDFQSRDNGWIFVDFENEDGEPRSRTLEMEYYPDGYWDKLTSGTEVTIRYLPRSYRNAEHVVLEEEFARVRDYSPLTDGGLGAVVLISWVIIMIKPHILYLGLADKQLLTDVIGIGEV
jgi:hypothetical protein